MMSLMTRFGFATLLLCGLVTDASAFGRKGCGGGRQQQCGNTRTACQAQSSRTACQAQSSRTACQARPPQVACQAQANQARTACQARPPQVACGGNPVQNFGSHLAATTAAIQAALPSFTTCNKQGCNKTTAPSTISPVFYQDGTPYSR